MVPSLGNHELGDIMQISKRKEAMCLEQGGFQKLVNATSFQEMGGLALQFCPSLIINKQNKQSNLISTDVDESCMPM